MSFPKIGTGLNLLSKTFGGIATVLHKNDDTSPIRIQTSLRSTNERATPNPCFSLSKTVKAAEQPRVHRVLRDFVPHFEVVCRVGRKKEGCEGESTLERLIAANAAGQASVEENSNDSSGSGTTLVDDVDTTSSASPSPPTGGSSVIRDGGEDVATRASGSHDVENLVQEASTDQTNGEGEVSDSTEVQLHSAQEKIWRLESRTDDLSNAKSDLQSKLDVALAEVQFLKTVREGADERDTKSNAQSSSSAAQQVIEHLKALLECERQATREARDETKAVTENQEKKIAEEREAHKNETFRLRARLEGDLGFERIAAEAALERQDADWWHWEGRYIGLATNLFVRIQEIVEGIDGFIPTREDWALYEEAIRILPTTEEGEEMPSYGFDGEEYFGQTYEAEQVPAYETDGEEGFQQAYEEPPPQDTYPYQTYDEAKEELHRILEAAEIRSRQRHHTQDGEESVEAQALDSGFGAIPQSNASYEARLSSEGSQPILEEHASTHLGASDDGDPVLASSVRSGSPDGEQDSDEEDGDPPRRLDKGKANEVWRMDIGKNVQRDEEEGKATLEEQRWKDAQKKAQQEEDDEEYSRKLQHSFDTGYDDDPLTTQEVHEPNVRPDRRSEQQVAQEEADARIARRIHEEWNRGVYSRTPNTAKNLRVQDDKTEEEILCDISEEVAAHRIEIGEGPSNSAGDNAVYLRKSSMYDAYYERGQFAQPIQQAERSAELETGAKDVESAPIFGVRVEDPQRQREPSRQGAGIDISFADTAIENPFAVRAGSGKKAREEVAAINSQKLSRQEQRKADRLRKKSAKKEEKKIRR